MNKTRLLVSFTILLALLQIGRVQVNKLLEDRSIWPPDDYVEYWAAGRLNLYGHNPYSPELLLPLEQHAGRDTDQAIMMWNPPWTLPFLMPLGAMPAREGQLLWFSLQFLAIVGSAYLIWELYTGLESRRIVGLLMAIFFLPTLFLLQSGQITGLVLLGVVLFLWCVKKDLPYLAGAATCLVAIKPHLAYLLWIAILFDAVTHRRGKILAGGAVTGLVLSLIPMATNPDVWSQYVEAYRTHPPVEWVSLTLGIVLRLILGIEHFWLQFVPMAIGVAWLSIVWVYHRHAWNWISWTPSLILISFLTAPYGAWHFDLVLMLLPILHRSAKLSIRPLTPAGWIGLSLLIVANITMVILVKAQVWTYYFAWVAPTVTLGYFLIRPRGVAYTIVESLAPSNSPASSRTVLI
jgi:hypothetical protein